MSNRIVLFGLLACVAADLPEALADEQPQKQDRRTEAATIAQWIADLDDGQFAVRQAASRKLREAGVEVVRPLAAAADGKRSEVTRRAIEVLDALCDSDDAGVAEAARQALEELADSTRRFAAHRASVVLRGQRLRRQWAALTEIQRLGGTIRAASIEDGELRVGSLLLGRRWEAGDEGLKHLTRLGRIEQLKLYGPQFTDAGLQHLAALSGVQTLILYATDISDDGQRRLEEALPGTQIDRRHGALLGVLGTPGTGCRISVKPGTAAERAGIETDDVITSVNGQAVADLPALIAIIAKQKPGDRIRVSLLRGDQPQEKDVVLGELGEDGE
ncbi:MAG TPA: PDZ domain-containing protein [Pirellulales bacterium]|nr:PDZ domain-containing protein [Pirellulales bacterium]